MPVVHWGESGEGGEDLVGGLGPLERPGGSRSMP